jgi:hypothetical protein
MARGTFRTFRATDQPCPGCGAPLEAASGVNHGDAPRADKAISCCAYCSLVMIFRADPSSATGLRLVPMSDEEREALHPETKRDLDRALQAVAKIDPERRRRWKRE